MTGKMSILVSLIITATISAVALLIGQFALAPQVTTDQLAPVDCAKLGLKPDETNPTKCSPVVSATSTPSTTPNTLPKPPTNSSVKFGTPVTLTLKKTQTFSDGMKLSLNSISDSRCKPNVQCIWAGELAPELSVTGGSFGKAVFIINLGTTRNTRTTQGNYLFTLVSARETEALVTVDIKSTSGSFGRVTGVVTIGPICPVEQVDAPCVIPPEVYTSRNVIVYGPTERERISATPLSPNGSYALTLAPGNYWLQIEPAGIGAGEKKLVTISADAPATLDFDIDTGIR